MASPVAFDSFNERVALFNVLFSVPQPSHLILWN